MNSLKYFLLVTTFVVFGNAYAHDETKNYNQISLEATASEEVANNTMIVSLYAQEEGSKATVQSDKVNKKINWALQKLESYNDIKVETKNYSTNPVYNKNKIVAWRVKQSLTLTTTNMSLMGDVLAELQQQLNFSGVTFDVSREKREQQTQSLIEQALTAYTKRATQIANKLRHDNYKIVSMHVSTSSNYIQPRYNRSTALMAESSSRIAPQMKAGERTLSVRVNGTIELE